MTVVEALRRAYHALPAPPSTNYNMDRVGIDPYTLIPRGGMVLDVGAGSTGGAYAFARHSMDHYGLRRVALDLYAAPEIACCGDAHRLPFRDGVFDAVLCVSTVEYVRDPSTVVAECHRVLKPGGVLYLSAPFVFPYHPPPEDFHRFSISGLRALAQAFDEIRAGSNRGPASTSCHVLVHFLAIALCFNSTRLYGVLLDGFKWLLFWVKYADRVIGHYDVAAVLHGNAFFLGRKPAAKAA